MGITCPVFQSRWLSTTRWVRGGDGLIDRLEHGGIAVGLITPQMLHRQHVDGEVLASGQFNAGTHHSGMLAVADQQPISFRKGQSP